MDIFMHGAQTNRNICIFIGVTTLAFILLVLLCVWIRGQLLKLFLNYGESVEVTCDSNTEEKMILSGGQDHTISREENCADMISSKHSSRKFLGIGPESLGLIDFFLHASIACAITFVQLHKIAMVENWQ